MPTVLECLELIGCSLTHDNKRHLVAPHNHRAEVRLFILAPSSKAQPPTTPHLKLPLPHPTSTNHQPTHSPTSSLYTPTHKTHTNPCYSLSAVVTMVHTPKPLLPLPISPLTPVVHVPHPQTLGPHPLHPFLSPYNVPPSQHFNLPLPLHPLRLPNLATQRSLHPPRSRR